MAPEQHDFPIWELPEVLLYHLVGYVAAPTHRARVLCHQIAPLCKASKRTILEASPFGMLFSLVTMEWTSTNLRSTNPQDLANDLGEAPGISSGANCLTKQKMCSILEEFGPYLRVNTVMSTGATFLVEICRARNVKEATILKCAEELVENRGANLDLATFEAQNSKLTALCVASVRGMPKVVKYLSEKGASRDIRCSGRFRLYTNARKSVRCNDSTALEFAQEMKKAELEEGSSEQNVGNLKKCIKLLQKYE